MIRGLYTSALGMLASQTQSEIISANTENLKTSGYKEQLASNKAFTAHLIQRMGDDPNGGATIMGEMGTGVSVDRDGLFNIRLGEIEQTDVKTDLALISTGYFVIQTPLGERYTRNGHFQLNGNGILQTPDGNILLGENGPIGPLSSNFSVSSDGTVIDNELNVDRLRVVEIPMQVLRHEGHSLYISSQPDQVINAALPEIKIVQGSIEASNVDLSGQMVQMMTVMKAYEANQKVIQTQDQMLGKAVNEVGKI